jgi:sugar phosphate isomerase/epimerase
MTRDLVFDGLDLLVRPGHQLDPHDPDAIPAAIHLLEREQIAVPMVTTDLTDPAALPAERLLYCCRAAGVQMVRLGHWPYDADRGYAACFEAARSHLDALERLARRCDIRLALQLHGGTIHSSGALTVALLAGHDPAYLGAYADPGNQALQAGSEDLHLTFDIVRPWLCCVGVKNGGWFPERVAPSGQRRWRADWLGVADGMVPWDTIIAHLRATGYDGFLSMHSFYEAPLVQALDQTRSDLRYIRRQIAAQPATTG